VKSVVFIDSETFLVTDFINLTIKPVQFFRCGHMSRMCVYISEWSYVYEYLHLYYVSNKMLSVYTAWWCLQVATVRSCVMDLPASTRLRMARSIWRYIFELVVVLRDVIECIVQFHGCQINCNVDSDYQLMPEARCIGFQILVICIITRLAAAFVRLNWLLCSVATIKILIIFIILLY
jgi:hypothetical protein